jgi:hypothetical protein
VEGMEIDIPPDVRMENMHDTGCTRYWICNTCHVEESGQTRDSADSYISLKGYEL